MARRLHSLSLFGNIKEGKRRPPRLVKYDGTHAPYSECDQEGAYLINGRIVCQEHGRAALQNWNAIVRGESLL